MVSRPYLSQALENRRGAIERIDNQGIKVHRISGRLLIDGDGETKVSVNFPVLFTELPAFSFGGEMDANQGVTSGSFPTISAVVVEWDTVEKMSKEFYYRGATLAVVNTGVSGHRIWLHWHMEGKAFRNPLNTSGNTDTAI